MRYRVTMINRVGWETEVFNIDIEACSFADVETHIKGHYPDMILIGIRVNP